MSEWQPIETAPKDGTRILIFDNGCISIANWHEQIDNYNHAPFDGWLIFYPDDAFYTQVSENPTHWMPLPEPPK